LQAPAEAIALYRAAYTSGWECVRHARYTRQQALQLLPAGLSATEREVGPPYAFPEIPSALGPNEINRALPWETLSPEQRAFQAEKMAIHAAMVHIMDQQIGRLLAQLRAMKALDNTLILFLSDNGASAEMMIRGDGHNPAAPMGSGESYLCLGPGWSTVANTPFRRHKTWVHEGGIATPLIVHWPAGIQDRNALRTDLCHVIDILPTFLSVAGLTPATQPRPQAPALPGISLMPAFAKEQALGARELFFHHEGNRALRTDAYKLVSATRDRNVWELYDMRTDRAEQHNLATQDPDRVNAMAARWQALEARFEQDSREPH
jgi:arylsulfatase